MSLLKQENKILLTIVLIIIGVILGALGTTAVYWIRDDYLVDWGTTATWALFFVAVLALVTAIYQINESRKSKRIDIAIHYITMAKKMLDDHTLHRAIDQAEQVVKCYSQDSLQFDLVLRVIYKPMDTQDYSDITKVRCFFYELGSLYRLDKLDKDLIRHGIGYWIPYMFDKFKPYIDMCRKEYSDDTLDEDWEYLSKELSRNIRASEDK